VSLRHDPADLDRMHTLRAAIRPLIGTPKGQSLTVADLGSTPLPGRGCLSVRPRKKASS
jgi:hypothetical protein